MSDFVITSNIREVERALTELRKDLWPKAFQSAAKEIGREALRDYRRVTNTWHHKPDFEQVIDVDGDEVQLLIGTDDEIFGYVDQGTRPHIIMPKKPGGRLAFQSGYRAKTVPGTLKSFSGGKFGPKVVRPWVMHPGTKARRFTQMIRDKTFDFARTTLRKHIRRWADKKYI